MRRTARTPQSRSRISQPDAQTTTRTNSEQHHQHGCSDNTSNIRTLQILATHSDGVLFMVLTEEWRKLCYLDSLLSCLLLTGVISELYCGLHTQLLEGAVLW